MITHPGYRLAQANVIRVKGRLDSPIMQPFTSRLLLVHRAATSAPGCIWHPAEIPAITKEGLFPNVSVWESVEDFLAFAGGAVHVEAMRASASCFDRLTTNRLALWWIGVADPFPTHAEGLAKIRLLDERGPTPEAFTHHKVFSPQALFVAW